MVLTVVFRCTLVVDFCVKVTNVNSCYILGGNNNGGLYISYNIPCTSNCREKDFTE